jgi:replication factor C subunit 2/4
MQTPMVHLPNTNYHGMRHSNFFGSICSLANRVEKYRPVYLDDVVGNSETIERLKIIAKDGNMPHVIISGMPGIGKTTSVLCLARTLLGDAYKEAVLELNASDERGIDVVRNRIKGFAQKKVTLPPGRHKLVILDEADRYAMGRMRWQTHKAN